MAVNAISITAGEAVLARKNILNQLRVLAAARGISQAQIAAMTGLSQSNVNRVLSGRYPPTLDTLLKITGALGLRMEFHPNDPRRVPQNFF